MTPKSRTKGRRSSNILQRLEQDPYCQKQRRRIVFGFAHEQTTGEKESETDLQRTSLSLHKTRAQEREHAPEKTKWWRGGQIVWSPILGVSGQFSAQSHQIRAGFGTVSVFSSVLVISGGDAWQFWRRRVSGAWWSGWGTWDSSGWTRWCF